MRQGTINLTALDRLIAIKGQFCFNAMPVSTKQVSSATLFICSLLVNTQANKGVKHIDRDCPYNKDINNSLHLHIILVKTAIND